MAWIYGDPPFPKKEKEVYVKLNRKLKDRELSEKIIKLWSLVVFLRKARFSSWKEVQESAYFDDAKTQPVFDDKTAKAVYRLLQKKGGSQYPVVNEAIEEGLRRLGDNLPGIISEPVAFVYNGASGIFTTARDAVPFGDLILEAGKTGASVANVTIENIAGAFGGAPGEIIAAVITMMIASAAASVHLLERDFGGAIEQIFRALPVVGSTLQTMLQKGEAFGSKIKGNYDKIQAQVNSAIGVFNTVKTNLQNTDFTNLESLKATGMELANRPELAGLKQQALANPSVQQAVAKATELNQKATNVQGKLQTARQAFNALPNMTAPAAGGRRKTRRRRQK
jgi:hypothetical protein